MKIKASLANKRGIAIENAIIFMIVIFSLCTIIITLALFGNFQGRRESSSISSLNELEQIGEDFLYSISSKTEFSCDYEGYSCELGENSLCVRNSSDGSELLFVEAELNEDGELVVKRWRCSK